jgi:hypothetical protein
MKIEELEDLKKCSYGELLDIRQQTNELIKSYCSENQLFVHKISCGINGEEKELYTDSIGEVTHELVLFANAIKRSSVDENPFFKLTIEQVDKNWFINYNIKLT